MRPRQWTKNAFVLAGLVFSGEVLDGERQLAAWTAAAAFCLMSGASYLVNDVRDAEADRRGPRTAGRPVARGELAPGTALAGAGAAAAAALALAAAVNWQTLATLAGFALLQLAYSLGLKAVLLVDVMAIAAGFVLRALAGLVAVDVAISEWLLLATGLLALFLGLAKRRGEVVALGATEPPGYSLDLLDQLIAVVAPTTVVVYALYAVLGARTELMLLTVPFVIYGIFRVLFLIHSRSGLAEEPEALVWRDRPLLACIVLWGIAAGTISFLSA